MKYIGGIHKGRTQFFDRLPPCPQVSEFSDPLRTRPHLWKLFFSANNPTDFDFTLTLPQLMTISCIQSILLIYLLIRWPVKNKSSISGSDLNTRVLKKL